MSPPPAKASPIPHRGLITAFTVVATLMQTLDSTIANVALPYMQGSLQTTADQVTWVLTSYIITAAIMTAPVGWLSGRYGRKNFLIVCLAGFTVASMLCGLSQSLTQMVVFRLLQGAFGAALVPLVAGDAARPLPDRGARRGHGAVGHGRHGRPHHRADARRLSHRRLRLALGVLHQSAVWNLSPSRGLLMFLKERNTPTSLGVRLDRLRGPLARHRRVAADA